MITKITDVYYDSVDKIDKVLCANGIVIPFDSETRRIETYLRLLDYMLEQCDVYIQLKNDTFTKVSKVKGRRKGGTKNEN